MANPLTPDAATIEQALSCMGPEKVRARLAMGQKFNAYETDPGYWIVGVGPVTDCLRIATASTQEAAEWIVRSLSSLPAISTAIRSRSDLREETYSEAFAAELDEKEFRDCFAEDQIRVRLALQIRALRQQRGLSQSQFGELVGMPQSSVARFENPDSGRLTLSSLFKIAAAFDIAFVGEFVDHKALLERTRSMTKERLEVESYTAQTLRAATPITTAGDMG